MYRPPDRVRKLLELLQTQNDATSSSVLMPDARSYHALIDAYVYNIKQSSDCIDKILVVQSEMEQAAGIRPTVRTFNSILHTCSKYALEHPEKADDIAEFVLGVLSDKKVTYCQTGDIADQPEVSTYTTIME